MAAGVQLGNHFVPQEVVAKRAARVSTGLHQLGVRRGDTVAIMLRNDIAFLEATAGARTLGALPVPINWHLIPDETAYILRDSEAKVFVVHEDILPGLLSAIPDDIPVLVVPTPPEVAAAYGVEKVPFEGPPNSYDWNVWIDEHETWNKPVDVETSSMIYTSGTTGRPKGVRRDAATLEQYEQIVQVVAGVLGVKPGIRTIIPAPMYHAAPNAYAVYAFKLGAFIVIMPRFDAEELLALIERHKITHIQMVPTMFVRLLKLPEEVRSKYDVSSLEYVVHAAAPCPPSVKEAMIEWWGPIIHEYYGSTEMSAVTFCSADEAIRHPGAVGKPLEGATVRILDADGREVDPGEPGTVYGWLHCNTDFTYQGDDEKRRSIERTGLITAGDVGYFDNEGYLYLCDRDTDLVISGGVNIYPAEIEGVLIEYPGVKDCAVFGIPDEDLGEVLMAIVEPECGAALNPDVLRAYLAERLARYKIPKHIEFQDNLPREDSGKLFKRKLRDVYWAQSARQI